MEKRKNIKLPLRSFRKREREYELLVRKISKIIRTYRRARKAIKKGGR